MSLSALKIRGPFRGPSGYDHHVREFVRQLHAQGVAVELVDLPEWGPVKLPPEMRDPWFESLNKPTGAGIVLHFCMPHQVVPESGRLNVNYTMFEATRIHASWVQHNREHELVILPTESSRQAWIFSGMPEDRIRVCPLGINPELFSGTQPPLPIRLHNGKPLDSYRVRFLNVSELGPRKNVMGLLRAWVRATFRQHSAVMVMKLGSYAPGWLDLLQHEMHTLPGLLGKSLDEAAPVHFIHDLLSDGDMPRLYAAATHYISMSHGEGWDQAMVEAAASRLSLIAPDHSAYRAYLDATTASLIPSRETPVDFGQFDPATAALFAGASWWDPDEEQAVALIRRAIAGGDRYLAQSRDRILAELTWEQSTHRLIEILEELQDERRGKRLWSLPPGFRHKHR